MSDALPSIEGLVTIPFCKVFEVAGHQILFNFELTPLDLVQHASIHVPGIGRITYSSRRPCDSHSDAIRWIESIDDMTARKTIAFLYGKTKGISRG